MIFHIRTHTSLFDASPGRTRYRRLVSVAACCVLALSAAAARGQAPPSTSATAPAAPTSTQPQVGSAAAQADALFNEGVTLLEAKSYAPACAKLQESQKLDPAPGTLINIGLCEQGQGRFATAARRWREALALLPADDSRYAKAQKDATEAENKAGRLVLRLAPQAPKVTMVSLDGRPVDAGELAAAILVDPGEHHIVVTAPGYELRDLTATAGSGEMKEVALAPGPAVPAPITTSLPTPTATPAPTAIQAPAPPTAQPGSLAAFFAQHKASSITLSTGIVVAAVGAGVAADIISGRYHAFVQKCVSDAGCSPADKSAMSAEATSVNVLFGVAGALGLAAVGIFIFAERTPAQTSGTQVSLAIGPTGASLLVSR